MQYHYQGGVQPPPKKSALPWILGGGCLLFVVAGGAFVVLLGFLAALGSDSAETTPAAAAPPAQSSVAPLPAAPQSGSRFVNERSGLESGGKLFDNFTAFSVDYPAQWTLKDSRKDGSFAVMTKSRQVTDVMSVEGAKATFTWWSHEKGAKGIIDDLDITGPKNVKRGPARVAGRDAYDAQMSVRTKVGESTMLIRYIAIPEEAGAKRGLLFVVMAEAGFGMGEKPEELGSKGDLKTLFDSLLVGADVPQASLAQPCGYSSSDNCMTCCSMYGHNRASGVGNRCTCQ
ncbi:MAG: hypothetical protein R3B89_00280 [Polyangiaceae bacterium]